MQFALSSDGFSAQCPPRSFIHLSREAFPARANIFSMQLRDQQAPSRYGTHTTGPTTGTFVAAAQPSDTSAGRGRSQSRK